MSATIYLVRHGETVWNRTGRLQGQLDAPLTRLGTSQSLAVGRTLREVLGHTDFKMIASPLGRTKQTASLIADQLGYDYEQISWEDRLMEITLGDRDGYGGWAELARDFPEEAARREADPWNFQYPNGESSEMVRQRVRPFLNEIRSLSGVFVLVSHGVTLKILRGTYLGLTEEQIFALDRPQDGCYRLENGTENFIPAEVREHA